MATSANLKNSPEQDPDLYGAILASVSRSFYLTIRALPWPLRRPIGLAYLLARTTDTIADSAEATPEIRLQALHQFGESISGFAPAPDLAPVERGVKDSGERELLAQAGNLLGALRQTEPGDRQEIVWVLQEILRGQTLDIQRFPKDNGEQVTALADAGELEAYTYSVAGCVGEFWTRICNRHLKHYSTRDLGEMVQLGISFGKGLQLVNILRDAPADLASGRCYLPADELGGPPENLRTHPAQARAAFAFWLARAREHLDRGLLYVEALRPWRLRFACFLPWALARKTLDLLERDYPLETPARIKVSRKQVRLLLLWGTLVGFSNFFFQFYLNRNEIER
ncbi:MAG: phytoene/squalene synthase family protein [Verrucomicrobiota bacterium]